LGSSSNRSESPLSPSLNSPYPVRIGWLKALWCTLQNLPRAVCAYCSLVAALLLLSAGMACATDRGHRLQPASTTSSSTSLYSQPRPLIGLADLGRALFADRRLSNDGTMSCASCHEPAKFFADELPTAKGHGGIVLTRNTPTLVGVADESAYSWDGKAKTIEMQVDLVLLNPAEFGPQSESDLIVRLTGDPRYARAFARLFPGTPSPISLTTVSKSIAAYVRTLNFGPSPFDRYFYEGESSAVSAAAIRGFELFRGRGNCASCHTVGDHPSPLSDGRFHASPLRLPAAADRDLAQLARLLMAARAARRNINELISTNREIASLGRFAVTLRPMDIGRFKTPSLRNVAVTGPYMHDGSVGSLSDAVELELYSRRDAEHRPIVLSEVEVDDIVEFLKSLTSSVEKTPVRTADAKRCCRPKAAQRLRPGECRVSGDSGERGDRASRCGSS
jgi:cytochrome c peroxidase